MDIEKIRCFFTKDRYLMLTGVRIEAADEGYAVCKMEIEEKQRNAGGVVQGGATYTLADSAFAVACNAGFIQREERRIAVSQSASISYMRPPAGTLLIATAQKISGGNRTGVYTIRVTDELGTEVAIMIGNACTVEHLLPQPQQRHDSV